MQEINKTQFGNFLKFINKLYRIRSNEDLLHELKPLSEKILNCNELVSKKWMLEAVRQFGI